MFAEEIRFPENFEVAEMNDEKCKCYTIVGMESAEWGVRDLYILIVLKDHGVGCDAIICIGKEVDQVYGDKKEVIERINYHISNFFRKKAKEKNLYYRY